MEKINDIIRASIEVKNKLIADPSFPSTINRLADRIANALILNKKIYLCGNGGSAGDAQHIAAELTGRFYKDRPAFAAEALHANTSYLTAVANDYGFDYVYSRMIEGLGQQGDILIGISTSGNSPNVVLAMKAAQSKKMITVAFTGEHGGKLKDYADYLFNVASNDTPRIQESHILIGHILCELIEEKILDQ